MIKKMLFSFLFIIYIMFGLYSQSPMKKHLFGMDFFTGGSCTSYQDVGGVLGINISYMYAINEYVAFGPGLNGLLSVMAMKHYDNQINPTVTPVFIFSGGLVLACLMVGDFKNRSLHFLCEFGLGSNIGISMGFVYKQFVCKLGYQVTYIGIAHHFTLAFGFKLGFGEQV